MSDTFDHELDAYEDLFNRDEVWSTGDYWNESASSSWHRSKNRESNFVRNSNHYHSMHKYTEIIHKTEKAMLINFTDYGKCWVPKSLCTKHKKKKRAIWIWNGFEFNPIKEN